MVEKMSKTKKFNNELFRLCFAYTHLFELALNRQDCCRFGLEHLKAIYGFLLAIDLDLLFEFLKDDDQARTKGFQCS